MNNSTACTTPASSYAQVALAAAQIIRFDHECDVAFRDILKAEVFTGRLFKDWNEAMFWSAVNARADLSGYTMERLLFRERSLAKSVDMLNNHSFGEGGGRHNTMLACWSMLWQTRDAIKAIKAERWCSLQRLPFRPALP